MARPAAPVLKSACAAQRMRVESIDGSFLGHVFDLRCTWPPAKGRPVLVDELIHGQSGLLERVGLRHRKPDSVAWSDVVELRGKVIVVEKK